MVSSGRVRRRPHRDQGRRTARVQNPRSVRRVRLPSPVQSSTPVQSSALFPVTTGSLRLLLLCCCASTAPPVRTRLRFRQPLITDGSVCGLVPGARRSASLPASPSLRGLQSNAFSPCAMLLFRAVLQPAARLAVSVACGHTPCHPTPSKNSLLPPTVRKVARVCAPAHSASHSACTGAWSLMLAPNGLSTVLPR